MLSKTLSFSLMGITALPVDIEVDINSGLPSTSFVGLADQSIRESKERVKSAIRNSGLDYPDEKITVSLAPADMKKEGANFDLPIALGILASSKQINKERLHEFAFAAELALDGSLRPVKGAISMSMLVKNSKKLPKNLILPPENAAEAAVVKGVNVFCPRSLLEVINFLSEPDAFKPVKINPEDIFKRSSRYEVDFKEVKGQLFAKRAIEVAAAGMHNILMIGPPGSGKSMLAKRIPTIMPDLTLSEALETTQIHSSSGMMRNGTSLIATRPFRAPHHTISNIALSGGGPIPKPGEVSLAHNGILFMDELPEFHRDVLEVLRQPLEDGNIRISRAAGALEFPCRFMLVCAMNPCPCGKYGQRNSVCRCSTTQVHRYRCKISGPLLDRVDIHIEVPAVQYSDLTSDEESESSESIRERVIHCHSLQKKRFEENNLLFNAKMNHKQLKKYCRLDKESSSLLKKAIEELGFSARAYDKILKVARTISDLAGSEDISAEHIAEAIQYRSLDREWF